ncbi:MAG: cysteine--tRNA ligase [Firmicutes bacterium]|nr:cysteine--tRNA ligase [Bacillota bacterium]
MKKANLTFFNSLTKQKQEFAPLSGGDTVAMYSCGPTVYNYAHIGNLRAYIFVDSVRRVLKYNGYKINGVMNITDVGHLTDDGDDGLDKMEEQAKKQKKAPLEIAKQVTDVFFDDLKKLNIERVEHIAKATDYINQMLKFIEGLEQRGFAYKTDDGVYFDTLKLDNYGILSGKKNQDLKAGARIAINTKKRNAADFALWKLSEKGRLMEWDSKYGMGYPGWHIECSAIARDFFGDKFDIHTGGIDHIPIHHENEIAQSCGISGGCVPALFWMHNEFMQVDGGKMSKSLGNVYTVSDLEGGKLGFKVSGGAFRYFCLNTHYRKVLNFTAEGIKGAVTAFDRLIDLLIKHKESKENNNSEVNGKIENAKTEFLSAINDDLNLPLGLGILWTLLKEPFSVKIFDAAIQLDNVLGLDLINAKRTESDLSKTEQTAECLPAEIAALLIDRAKARADKDFALSDKLRDELANKGYAVIDQKGEQIVSKI